MCGRCGRASRFLAGGLRSLRLVSRDDGRPCRVVPHNAGPMESLEQGGLRVGEEGEFRLAGHPSLLHGGTQIR